MSEEFFEFGIGEGDEKVGKKIVRFSAEKRTYRLGFSYWDGLGKDDLDECMKALLKAMTTEDETSPATPKFIGAARHYKPGVGYFLAKGPEYAEIAGEPPKTYVATIIIAWPSDQNGNVTKESLGRLPDLYPWVFSKDKYQPISAAHNQFPFGDHDLMVTCTDTQYQKMTFLPAKASLFRSFIERALGDEVLQEVFGKEIKGDPRPPDKRSREVVEYIVDVSREIKGKLRDYIARDLSLQAIREKLGNESSPVSGSGGSAPMADEEVDGLLGDILEDD